MKRFFREILSVWYNEFRLVFTDIGVVTFFVALPLLYPVVYSLIYNPEMPHDVAVVVVDDDRSAESREYVRSVDATPQVAMVGYAADMQEARRMLKRKECYGILHLERGFGRSLGRGETAVVELYSDMSLLYRYKNMLLAVSTTSLELGAEHRNEMVSSAGAQGVMGGSPVDYKLVPLGNVSQGFASAVMPGVLLLILQQAFILGIAQIFITSRERARRCGGVDPESVPSGVLSMLIGKVLCYMVMIAVPVVYLLRVMPITFDFVQIGAVSDMVALMLPYVLCVFALGMIVQSIIPDREAVFPLFVFTSVMFVFLSGISWPIFAMPRFWQAVAYCLPSTWAVNGYVLIMSTGATLAQQAHTYHVLWLMAAVYMSVAYVVMLLQRRRGKNRAQGAIPTRVNV